MPTPNPNKRARRASFRLADPENEASFDLIQHRDARSSAQAEAASAAARSSQAVTPDSSVINGPPNVTFANLSSSTTTTNPRRPNAPTRVSTRGGTASCEDADDEEADLSSTSTPGAPARKKRCTRKNATPSRPSTAASVNATSPQMPTTPSDDDDPPLNNGTQPDSMDISDDELPRLETPTDSEDDVPAPATKRNRTEDIDACFGAPVRRGPKGAQRTQRKCNFCSPDTYLVNECSTLRRHIQSRHKKRYIKWCKNNDFVSMLPGCAKARKAAATAPAAQTTLDGHVVALDDDATIRYSDARFREAAEDWLIETNQPLDALSHPKFHHMINVASRATNGVKIPEKRATREHIIERFRKNVSELTERLNSDAVKGEVSMTCDAWQASNRDAYFAVTGHWVEEVTPTDWRLRSALLGFTQMNTAHSGALLGRALYNVAKRYKITHKVGWITCDNASNNTTMLKTFETKINLNKRRQEAGVRKWEARNRHIRCLAHIVNLATQALLAKYSSTPHLNTDSPTSDVDQAIDDLTDAFTICRDEIGLVRMLAVKARSSAKRSQLLKDIQSHAGVKIPLNLILDMKVRWSSTFAMLQRAYELRDVITKFVFSMSAEETNTTKQAALLQLKLSEEEWDRVRGVLRVLKPAENAQHAFSTETNPALSHALPALEKLHKVWTSMMEKEKYSHYREAINAGLEKVSSYYNKTSAVDAYTIAMILDPSLKTQYFQKHWGEDLELAARKQAEKIFEARWIELHGSTPAALSATSSHSQLDLDADSDDEEVQQPSTRSAPISKPWMKEFLRYVDGDDELDEGQGVVGWWGFHARRLPTWASLARDYLAIMASSVSSERAFSAAGITISKRRNSLKADIVEALQVLRSLINTDLIFREPDHTPAWEFENDVEDDDGNPEWEDVSSDLDDEVVS